MQKQDTHFLSSQEHEILIFVTFGIGDNFLFTIGEHSLQIFSNVG